MVAEVRNHLVSYATIKYCLQQLEAFCNAFGVLDASGAPLQDRATAMVAMADICLSEGCLKSY